MQIPNINLQSAENSQSPHIMVPDALAELDRGWKATLLGLVLLLVQVLLPLI